MRGERAVSYSCWWRLGGDESEGGQCMLQEAGWASWGEMQTEVGRELGRWRECQTQK